ncbi:MAG: DUF2624 family protein [Firmicutes bacterium]|nr:DUF2624 family protein [Bacillota bacterium]
MYKELIKKYIKNLTPQDIKNYALSLDVNLTNEEVNIIFNFLLQYYEELLNKNTKVLEKLKPYLRDDLYNKIIILYEEKKNKYL